MRKNSGNLILFIIIFTLSSHHIEAGFFKKAVNPLNAPSCAHSLIPTNSAENDSNNFSSTASNDSPSSVQINEAHSKTVQKAEKLSADELQKIFEKYSETLWKEGILSLIISEALLYDHHFGYNWYERDFLSLKARSLDNSHLLEANWRRELSIKTVQMLMHLLPMKWNSSNLTVKAKLSEKLKSKKSDSILTEWVRLNEGFYLKDFVAYLEQRIEAMLASNDKDIIKARSSLLKTKVIHRDIINPSGAIPLKTISTYLRSSTHVVQDMREAEKAIGNELAEYFVTYATPQSVDLMFEYFSGIINRHEVLRVIFSTQKLTQYNDDVRKALLAHRSKLKDFASKAIESHTKETNDWEKAFKLVSNIDANALNEFNKTLAAFGPNQPNDETLNQVFELRKFFDSSSNSNSPTKRAMLSSLLNYLERLSKEKLQAFLVSLLTHLKASSFYQRDSAILMEDIADLIEYKKLKIGKDLTRKAPWQVEELPSEIPSSISESISEMSEKLITKKIKSLKDELTRLQEDLRENP